MTSLLYLNKYFFRYRIRLFLGMLFVAVSSFFDVYSAPYVGKAVDEMEKAVRLHTPLADAQLLLLKYALIIIGMVVLRGVFMFFMRQTIIVMSRHIEYDLKNDIYAHYQKLDQAFYKNNNTGDLMNRLSEDVSRVRMYIGPAIMYIVNTLATFLLTIGVMFSVDASLSLYVLAPFPILAISIYYVSSTINRKSTRVQQQLSKLSTMAQESFSGIRVLKAFGREKFWQDQFQHESENYKEKNLSLARTEAMFQPFMVLLIGLSTLITIYTGGKEAIAGNITTGKIPEFVLYVLKLTWPVASLGWVTSLVQRAAASQTRINEFLQTKPAIHNPTDTELSIKGKIEFKNVSFTYPESGIKALNNVSFSISPNHSLAIIGKTGSGKSTIANLICRLDDVQGGQVVIDNQDIRAVNLHSLRSQIGYVPQEVFLFSETIAANIAFSAIDKKSLAAEISVIEQAAKDAAVYNNIQDLKDKFDTVVGERGVTLSGGQKQRISIARAIIKSPRILILDDCLSAVDTETEEEILTNLRRIMKDRTSVIISHRASSVKHADHIIILDQGNIIEQGKHDDLMLQKGYYFEMYQQQLKEQ